MLTQMWSDMACSTSHKHVSRPAIYNEAQTVGERLMRLELPHKVGLRPGAVLGTKEILERARPAK